MTTFALIHGAYHSGAHWAPLVAELRTLGFGAVAPDLPVTNPDAGASEYADAVVAALGGAGAGAGSGEHVILVAHSLGGLTAPVVASRIEVAAIVYLCALLPEPGSSFDDYAARDPSMFGPPAQTHPRANRNGSASSHPAHATEVWYHDCGWERARWACSLLRPQHWKVTRERTPLDRMPDVPSWSIVAAGDRAVNPEWSRRVVLERLGATLVEIEGGHSPQIARPAEVAAILARVAASVGTANLSS